MKYYGGCDSGSTYTKCVIIDETGKMVTDVTLRSRINAVLSCEESIEKAVTGAGFKFSRGSGISGRYRIRT